MKALEIVAAMPPDVGRVIDYGPGGVTLPARPVRVRGLKALCGSRMVVQEGTAVEYCPKCGSGPLRVWRYAIDPPDAFGESPAGVKFWARLPWEIEPCFDCLSREDPERALKDRADLARVRRHHRDLIARRRGDDRLPTIYTQESED